MKKIITAINNPKLNEELKKEKNFEVIGKDIQYKEAILEILEKKDNIDLIIISEKILGEIKLEKLIEKIKLINEKIKIIFILEKENNELEKILIKNNIIDIYYNNKINLIELIKIINKKEINMEEEIIKLKKIIEEKNINYNQVKKNKKIEKKKVNLKNDGFNKIKNRIKSEIKNKLKKQLNKKTKANYNKNMSTKIITFSGNYKSGKTTLSLIISQCLAEKNNRVLLIDGDLEKQDLSTLLKANQKRKNKKKRKKNNIFFNNYFKKVHRTKLNKNNFKFNKYNKKINNKNKIENKYKINNKKIKLINKNKIKLINKKYKSNNNYKKNINLEKTLSYYNIKNKIKLFTKKVNKNLYFFYGLNYLLKNKKIENQKIMKKIIFIFFKIIKKNYNFIIFDLSKSNLEIINQEILKISDINFILMEPNLLGIKEVDKLLKKYNSNWKISIKSLHIVINKKNIISMNKKLILKNLCIKNKILEIKENKSYGFISNQYFRRKIFLKNKIIKKEIDKIIYKKILKNRNIIL